MQPSVIHSAGASKPLGAVLPERPRASEPLPAATLEGLREFNEFSHVFAKRGYATVWAIGYEARHGKLPSARQVVLGVQSDLKIRISRMSACRALSEIRSSKLRKARSAHPA